MRAFPLDLIYLTIDSWRIVIRRMQYRRSQGYEGQRCIYCRDYNGFVPRLAPGGIRKYRHRWMIAALQPCVVQRKTSKGRLTSFCRQEGGYVHYTRRALVVALGMTLFWILLAAALLLWLLPAL